MIPIEKVLRAAELEATETAEPTSGASETIAACRATGRAIAIVSNNSTTAVEKYLSDHGLRGAIDLVIGRANPDPALLKPSPHLIRKAVRSLRADVTACTLVGDSISDIESARIAQVWNIGYANKPGKRNRLASAGADAITSDMTTFAMMLHKIRPARH